MGKRRIPRRPDTMKSFQILSCIFLLLTNVIDKRHRKKVPAVMNGTQLAKSLDDKSLALRNNVEYRIGLGQGPPAHFKGSRAVSPRRSCLKSRRRRQSWRRATSHRWWSDRRSTGWTGWWSSSEPKLVSGGGDGGSCCRRCCR